MTVYQLTTTELAGTFVDPVGLEVLLGCGHLAATESWQSEIPDATWCVLAPVTVVVSDVCLCSTARAHERDVPCGVPAHRRAVGQVQVTLLDF